MLTARELLTASPVEVDNHLVEVYTETAALQQRLTQLKIAAQLGEQAYSRGRWTRAFLVTGGHLHRSTDCSTCYPTTQFHWLTNLSGQTEEELVAMAGERACTVCYPSAPVDVLRRKSVLFTPDEEAAEAARAERETKRAAAKAAEITVEDLYEASWKGERRAKTFKSERAVSNLLTRCLKDTYYWGRDGQPHPSDHEWKHDARQLAAALSEIRGIPAEEIYAEADKKAKAAVERETRAFRKQYPHLAR